jgi:3-oxoadipate enol-lactonase
MSEFFTLGNGDALFLDEHHAVSAGSNARPVTLVALHGLGGGGYFFAAMGRSLAGSVFSPDMPGSGRSPRGQRPISFDHFADAIVQLIERKTSGPVTLMGHSMGTIVALKVYSRIPNRIASMIFIGGLPAPLPEVKVRLRNLAALARSSGMAAVAQAVVPVVFAPQSLDAIPDQVAMFQRLLTQSDAEGYAQTAIALADASAADVVPQVRVPCLCVTGTYDRYAPPAPVRALADSLSTGVYKEIPDCAHMPFFEAPDALRDIVQSFLAEST